MVSPVTENAAHPARRATAASRRQDDVDRLVRQIHADPVLLDWLRGHVADHLDAAATKLEELSSLRAAGVVHARARAHRRGEDPQ